jgi:hypothetical protein
MDILVPLVIISAVVVALSVRSKNSNLKLWKKVTVSKFRK